MAITLATTPWAGGAGLNRGGGPEGCINKPAAPTPEPRQSYAGRKQRVQRSLHDLGPEDTPYKEARHCTGYSQARRAVFLQPYG